MLLNLRKEKRINHKMLWLACDSIDMKWIRDGCAKQILCQTFDHYHHPRETALPGMIGCTFLNRERTVVVFSWLSSHIAPPNAFFFQVVSQQK